MSIQEGRLFYHLTDLTNLASIFLNGLKPRSELLFSSFSDIADHEILDGREHLNLESYVPFHFMQKSPFAGATMNSHRDKNFVYITIQRSKAKQLGFKIIPLHPLTNHQDTLTVMDYDQGFGSIDWIKMETRTYLDPDTKMTCMAEAIHHGTLPAKSFHCIYVKDESTQAIVQNLLKQYNINIYVTIMEGFFI